MIPRPGDDPAYAALEGVIRDMISARSERDEANAKLARFIEWAEIAWTLLNSDLTHPVMEAKVTKLLAQYPASAPPGHFRAPGQPWPGTPNKETP